MPLFSLPADLISSLTSQLPLFFIAERHGAAAAGVFALAVKIIGGPVSLFGAAVSDVFRRDAALSFREVGNCRAVYGSTLGVLGVLGCLLAILVPVFGEEFFAFAYGGDWRRAGSVAVWLAPLFAAKLIASPLGYMFYIRGAQGLDFGWQCALLFITIVVFWTVDSFQSAIQYYSAAHACMYILYFVFSFRLSWSSKK